jgi:hypothetical protein
MEEAVAFGRPLVLRKAFELCHGQVTQENCCLFTWLPADTFLDIANGEIYWPC